MWVFPSLLLTAYIFWRHYFFTCALMDVRVVHMQMWLMISKWVDWVEMCPGSLGISLGAAGHCSHCLGALRHQNQWMQEKGLHVPAGPKSFCLAKRNQAFNISSERSSVLFCLMLSISQEFSRCVLVITACAKWEHWSHSQKTPQHFVRAELTLGKQIMSAPRILPPKWRDGA